MLRHSSSSLSSLVINGQRRLLPLTLAAATALTAHLRFAQAPPLLDEVIGLESGGSIRFDPGNRNHDSVARLEFLGHTISADGDYQYWYDILSGNRAWTRDVSFWVCNAETITNLTDENYTETGAERVLQHWWGTRGTLQPVIQTK